MSAKIDLTGKTFGAWQVLEYAGLNQNRQPSWACRCECGTEKIVVGQTLRDGATSSCGCKKGAAISKSKLKHGESLNGETRTYRIWKAMHARCRGLSEMSKKYYVPKNITVCERWSDYRNFVADMGVAPDNLSIDRIDNDGNYEPGNCRWATASQQAQNQYHSPRNRDEITGQFVKAGGT